MIAALQTDREVQQERVRVREEKLTRAARESLLAFTVKTKRNYEVNWHHKLLCEKLDAFVEGKIKRLIVIMPPRHGKSELVSRRLPAYIFGRKPDAKIIACSYNATLAYMMNRDCQRIIDSIHYQQVFPETTLFGKNIRTVAHGTALRNSEIFEIVDREGQYRAAGIGGGITGMGADYALIDDPIKNQEEADSEVFREKTWQWYTSTLYTRLEKDDHVLLTLTRWNEDDLAGRLLKQMKDDPDADQWEVLHLEASKTDEVNHPQDPRKKGEALWPGKYDEQRLKKVEAVAGPRTWTALFQGRPKEEGGNIYKREMFARRFTQRPKDFIRIIQSWDTAAKDKEQNDYTACCTWLEGYNSFYLLHAFKERMQFPEMVKKMMEMFDSWKPSHVFVEDTSAGISAIQYLKRKTKMPVIALPADKDKVARAKAVTGHLDAGNVLVPERAEWLNDFMDELMGFPNAKHDDYVDAFNLGLEELTSTMDTWEDEMGYGTTESSQFNEELTHV